MAMDEPVLQIFYWTLKYCQAAVPVPDNNLRTADVEECKAIVKTLEIYCGQGGAANVGGVKKALHETGALNGPAKDGCVFGPIRNLSDLHAQAAPAPAIT